ncbi:LdpA C-terminal domain-containing domain [Prochlorococcus sp. MIT 1223]|uniref:Light dependent period protein LdpA domain-containing protein n=1 Tax=Prochlorococcus sp. MIT 1223 TaxID=3096217 RepID=UPI002A753591|nr:LdpA C-terminal domain-containing domain [Prochlorococcus sp. MIT 1223]
MKKPTIANELALSKGTWVKLICGASNQDLASISDLCAIYAAAGVNCIDVAADIAVVNAAEKGLNWVETRFGKRPWLMISVSDGKDVHFRKAHFNPESCPADCPRPCEKVCPTNAINQGDGINKNLCYGCGRCLTTCPLGIIEEKDQSLKINEFGSLIAEANPDAVEIHTAPGRLQAFEESVKAIVQSNVPLKRIAVSCGLQNHSINIEILSKELWQRHECLCRYKQKPIWQLDGRPMSGDLGKGTGKFAISLWQKIRPIAPPGPLQLAGGTNSETINYLSRGHSPSGVAFGGMARKLIQPLLLEAQAKNMNLIDWNEGWDTALERAQKLINPWLQR